jgi:hypothetical protein
MEWKVKIEEQLKQATNQRKISTPLKKLVKIVLSGDTRFNLVYSSSREQYVTLVFRETLSKLTSSILLKNGYKQIYLNNK